MFAAAYERSESELDGDKYKRVARPLRSFADPSSNPKLIAVRGYLYFANFNTTST
jgi:hypothetical protein